MLSVSHSVEVLTRDIPSWLVRDVGGHSDLSIIVTNLMYSSNFGFLGYLFMCFRAFQVMTPIIRRVL